MKVLEEFIAPGFGSLIEQDPRAAGEEGVGSENRKHYVYALVHTEQNLIFYIGRSTVKPTGKDRFEQHLYKARTGSPLPVHRKIRKLQEQNQTIRCDIVKTYLTQTESEQIEKDLIACHGLDNLTNISPGGADWAWFGAFAGKKDVCPVRDKQKWIDNKRKAAPNKAVLLRNIKTQKETLFSSLSEASRVLGIERSQLGAVARGKRNKTRGYKVTFLNEESEVLSEFLV